MAPMNLSVVCLTIGILRIGPMMGICLRADRIAGKKLPNRLMIPKHSMRMPSIGHPTITNAIPPIKHILPAIFPLRQKNLNVRSMPIRRTIPERNRKLPRASSALSKNITTPRNRKKAPNDVRKNPISVL